MIPIGRGIVFPFILEDGGVRGKIQPRELIRQSLITILAFRIGTRWLNSEFGSRVKFLLHQPLDTVTASLLSTYATDAITRYEPRVKLEKVTTNIITQSSTILLTLKYKIRESGEVDELNVPFINQQNL